MMGKIEMVSIKLHPNSKKSIHFKTVGNAISWLNLSTFEYFVAYVHCAGGKNHRGTFKYTQEFLDWVNALK
jgi:hypothetical protein